MSRSAAFGERLASYGSLGQAVGGQPLAEGRMSRSAAFGERLASYGSLGRV
ncbi:MAG: hypothetical protein PHF72_05805 [Gammaproteobacteria bacterium]|nr:hypothetical protein [Gammaproteobacteria bacterium]